MSQQVFERNTEELITAAEHCLKNGQLLPGLLLVYAGIDIMASLNRPEDQEYVKRDDYTKWVDEYLLPDIDLACSALELYAARCGMIHTYTAKSRLFDKGRVRKVFYAWDSPHWSAKDLQSVIDHTGESAVAVQIETLFEAFRTGVDRFKQSLANTPKRANRVYNRIPRLFELSQDRCLFDKVLNM